MAEVRRIYEPGSGEIGKKGREGSGVAPRIVRPSHGPHGFIRALLSAVSYLNFLQWVSPGGFCHRRHWRNAVNETGAMELRRNGKGRADAEASVSDDLRNDTMRRREMLGARPAKTLLYGVNGGFVWYPRLPQLR